MPQNNLKNRDQTFPTAATVHERPEVWTPFHTLINQITRVAPVFSRRDQNSQSRKQELFVAMKLGQWSRQAMD